MMKIEYIPENDYDRMELGLITPEQLGQKMAKETMDKLNKEIKVIWPFFDEKMKTKVEGDKLGG